MSTRRYVTLWGIQPPPLQNDGHTCSWFSGCGVLSQALALHCAASSCRCAFSLPCPLGDTVQSPGPQIAVSLPGRPPFVESVTVGTPLRMLHAMLSVAMLSAQGWRIKYISQMRSFPAHSTLSL